MFMYMSENVLASTWGNTTVRTDCGSGTKAWYNSSTCVMTGLNPARDCPMPGTYPDALALAAFSFNTTTPMPWVFQGIQSVSTLSQASVQAYRWEQGIVVHESTRFSVVYYESVPVGTAPPIPLKFDLLVDLTVYATAFVSGFLPGLPSSSAFQAFPDMCYSNSSATVSGVTSDDSSGNDDVPTCEQCKSMYMAVGAAAEQAFEDAECPEAAGGTLESCAEFFGLVNVLFPEVTVPVCVAVSAITFVSCTVGKAKAGDALGSALCPLANSCCPSPCATNAVCDATIGDCVCAPGYYGTPPACSASNNCGSGSFPCAWGDGSTSCCDDGDVCTNYGCCPPGQKACGSESGCFPSDVECCYGSACFDGTHCCEETDFIAGVLCCSNCVTGPPLWNSGDWRDSGCSWTGL